MDPLVRPSIPATLLICCLLIPACWAAAQSPAADADRQKHQGCTISGKVFLAGKAASGVTVVVFRREDFIPIARARTDETGHYEMTGLAGGEYDVTPFAPVFVPPNPTPSLSNNSIVIRDGEAADGVNFELVRGAVITGRITRPDGQPLIGENIYIRPIPDNGSFSLASQPGTQTDDRGVYRVYGLPPGKYSVGVLGSHFRHTYYPGVTELARATPVEIEAGSETNIDIAVAAPVVRYAVVGRAIDTEAHQPVPNARFEFKCVEGEEVGLTGSGYQTDSNGAFRIDGLASGRYRVSADFNHDYYSDPFVFEVSDQDLSGLELKLNHGAVVSGIAVVEGVDQPEVTSHLADLSLNFSVQPSDPVAYPAKSYFLQLAPGGTFRIGGLPPGLLGLGLSGNGTSGFSIARIEVNGIDHRADGIRLGDQTQITGVRLVLRYGSGAIRGQIKTNGGSLPLDTPLYVVAVLVSEARWRSDMSRISAGGMFEIGGLIDGEYQLEFYNLGRNTPRGVKVTVTNGEAPFSIVNFNPNPQPEQQK